MKKYLLILMGLLAFGASYSAAYQQQGFNQYQEVDGKISFWCQNQCVILLGDQSFYDSVVVRGGTRQGDGQRGYGYLIGSSLYTASLLPANSYEWLFTDNPNNNQLPKGERKVAFLVTGPVKAENVEILMERKTFMQTLNTSFKQALSYVPYNPRTINFLEFPKWSGKYINQAFFWWIVVLLGIAFFAYILSKDNAAKKKSIVFGVAVIAFFWIFFDALSTANQVKMYNEVMSTDNIMDNGRLADGSDFYQFLDFVKQSTHTGEQGYFLSPYPFGFEGQYHVYPHVRLGTITGSRAIIVYNPYGPQNPFGFIDPVFDASGSKLSGSGRSIDIEKEIVWQPYAKIYLVK